MSIFGGDSNANSVPSSPSEGSDFSISPIPSPQNEPTSQHAQDTRTHDAQPDTEEALAEELSPDQHSSEDDEQLSDSGTRPNRFRGNSSSWKFHTRDERRIAASLDEIRAGDLSKHLYNSHAWRARLSNEQESRNIKGWHRKSRWIDKNAEGRKPWYPDNLWTLWPLEPDVLPSTGEAFGVPKDASDGYTYRMDREERSKKELEEELCATTMRLAKEKWIARPEQEQRKGRVQSSVANFRPSRRTSSRSRSTSRPPDAEDEDETSPKGEGVTKDSDTEIEIDEDLISNISDRPVLSANENRLHQILQPSINSLLTRLDDLLTTLHNNRQGHYINVRDGDDASNASSRSASRSRSRSRSRSIRGRRHAPSSKKRPLEKETPVVPAIHGGSVDDDLQRSPKKSRLSQYTLSLEGPRERSESVTSSQSDQSLYGPHTRNPRDWSEVLGAAALSGWDNTTLERAATRCAALFGEGMSFRMLSDQASNAQAPSSKASVQPGRTFSLAASKDAHNNPTKYTQCYRCPEEDCWRHHTPFTLSEGFRFRDHLKRKHKYTAEDVEELELALHIGGSLVPSNKDNPRGWQPPDPITCPHLDCPRSTAAFAEPRRLIDHLKRVHKYDPRKESPPGGPALRRQSTGGTSDASLSSAAGTDVEVDLAGGVHNDGFMKPIAAFRRVRGRGRGKTRTT